MGVLQEGCRSSFGLDVRLLRFQNQTDSEEPTMLSNDLLSAGRVHDALRVAALALTDEKDDAELWLVYGQGWRIRSEASETREEDLSRAQGCFINAARFAPDWSETWRMLAEVLVAREQHRRAADVACRALAHGSTDESLRKIYEQARMVADLLDRVSRFEQNPDSEDPAMLAQVLLATGRLAQADEVTSKAIEVDADDVDLLAVRARVLHQKGDHDNAIKMLEKLTLLDPDWRDGWNELEALYTEVGNTKAARRAARESVRVAARAARRDTYIPPARKSQDAPVKMSDRLKLEEQADLATTHRLQKPGTGDVGEVDEAAQTMRRQDPSATLKRTEEKPLQADATWKADIDVVDDASLAKKLLESSWEQAKSEPGFSLDIMVELDGSKESKANPAKPLAVSKEDSGLHLLQSDDDILDQLASELLAEGLTTSPTSPGWVSTSPWSNESSAGSVAAENVNNTRDMSGLLRFDQPEPPLEIDIEVELELTSDAPLNQVALAEPSEESQVPQDDEVPDIETAPPANYVEPTKMPSANTTWRLGVNSHSSRAAIESRNPESNQLIEDGLDIEVSLEEAPAPIKEALKTSAATEEIPADGVGDARALKLMRDQLLAEREASQQAKQDVEQVVQQKDVPQSHSTPMQMELFPSKSDTESEMKDDANISQSEASHLYAVTDTNPVQETFDRVAEAIASGDVDFVRISTSKQSAKPAKIELELTENVAVGTEVTSDKVVATKATPRSNAVDPFETIATILQAADEEEVLLDSVFGTQSVQLEAVASDTVDVSSAFGNVEAPQTSEAQAEVEAPEKEAAHSAVTATGTKLDDADEKLAASESHKEEPVQEESVEVDIDAELDSFMEVSHPFVERTIAGDLLSPETIDPVRMNETLPGVAIPAEHGGQPRQKPSGRAAWVMAGSRTLRRGSTRRPYEPATPKRIYPGCELDLELSQNAQKVGR